MESIVTVCPTLQVTENNVTLKGGVWSLDGSEELLHTMSLSPEEPNSSSDSAQPPPKVAKTSSTFCGMVPLAGHKDFMTKAHQLGISLAQTLIGRGADKILQAAKAQNAINVPPSNSSTSSNNVVEKEIASVNGS